MDLNEAISNILNLYYGPEEEDFLLNYDPEKDFMEQFIEHNIYYLVALQCRGNEEEILEWIDEFINNNNLENDESDESDYESVD